MGLKTNIALGVLATGGLLLGGGSAGFLIMQNQKAHEVENDLETFDIDNLTAVAGYTVVDEDEKIVLLHQFSGGNTMLAWDAEKNKPGGANQAFSGTWKNLTGAIAYDAQTRTLRAVEVVIQTNSIIGHGGTHPPAPPTLTNTLIGETPGMPAWFDLENHPTATFTASEFIAREQASADGIATFDNAPEGWTHLLRGTFTLNGQELALDIPARVEFIGEELVLALGFQLNRSDFDIDGTIVGGWVVDDTINLQATVESAPKGDIIVDTLRAHDVRLAENRALIDSMGRMENQIEELTSQIAALSAQVAAGVTVPGNGGADTPAIDTADLPASFTDQVAYPNGEPLPFDMVLVPGDADAGIAPFYMGVHEVTWDLFYDWAYAKDIGVQEQVDLQALDLRPSPLYEDCDQLKFGRPNRPALSMSRRTAEAFCKWLTEETGRHYRLPTDAEWHLAVELGGGIPADRAELLAQAVFQENAAEHDDLWIPMTSEVGSLAPNKLGIYDLLGNAAEWVTDTGSDRVVRGGYFDLSAEAFDAQWKAVEDQRIWNATYPQAPVSRFWYRDHYYQGIRLVCDPVNLPE